MTRLHEKAEKLRTQLSGLDQEIQQALAEAGSLLMTDQGVEIPGETRDRDNGIGDQIEKINAQRERILAIRDRLSDAKEQESATKARQKELLENLDPIYEDIGRLAFGVYRSNPLVDQQYADIFSPLVEVNSELSGIDSAIADQEALLESKPFLEKMVIRGRIALLKNRKTTREGSFRRLVRNAGRDILGTSFVEEIGDPSLTAAAEPYQDRIREKNQCDAELQEIAAERASLTQELEKMDAAKRPQRRIAELDDDIQTLQLTRNSIRAEAARAFRESGSPVPESCAALFATIAEHESTMAETQSVLERVNAALEADRLEHQAAQIAKEISVKESKQAELKRELTELRKRKKETESAREAQIAIRGDLDELVAAPDEQPSVDD